MENYQEKEQTGRLIIVYSVDGAFDWYVRNLIVHNMNEFNYVTHQ